MEIEIVKPNVKNFIKSLRDIGYTFEIAVADIIDNSISAGSKNIKISALREPELVFSIFDDGSGMEENELIEAMRLSSKDPDEQRNRSDLGKFGLGLKVASFSQCRKLTVLSKKNGVINGRQWDLDYISQENEWSLIKISESQLKNYDFIDALMASDSGTIVTWELIDRYPKESFSEILTKLRSHLGLVFHKFIERKQLKLFLNEGEIPPFNPFNPDNFATQQGQIEKIRFQNDDIFIQPFILPHHSKLTQDEYDRYSTEEGYIKSQGFYLYRADRLLVYGTWWGLLKTSDAYKLTRIKIDIPNTQDSYWGIDVKKSMASPHRDLKKDLKRIVDSNVTKSSRVYSGRGKIIEDKTSIRFWNLIPENGNFRFGLDRKHPLLETLKSSLSEENKVVLDMYIKGLEEYLPLSSIQAHLQEHPLKVKQESGISDESLKELVKKLRDAGMDDEAIESFYKTELFKNKREILNGIK